MKISKSLTITLVTGSAFLSSCKEKEHPSTEQSSPSTTETTKSNDAKPIPSSETEISYGTSDTAPFTGELPSPHESSIVFTNKLPQGMVWKDSAISLDPQRSIWSDHSLKWDWKQGSEITFHRPIPWNNPKQARALTKHFHTVETLSSVWIYNAKALPDAQLEFQFYNKNNKVCSFPFNLNFTGWRTARVSFDTEMQGTPTGPMDYLTIVAPKGVENGTLWLGDMVLSKIVDSRHRHGDYQVPFVKKADQLKKGHWDPIMYWYELGKNAKAGPALTDSYSKAFESLRPSIEQTEKLSADSLAKFEESFKKYNISRTANGAITGDHVYMTHHLDAAPANKTQDGHLLKPYTTEMLQIAKKWSKLTNDEQHSDNGKRLAEIYCLMSEHLLDQGFAAGSAQGTMHHFGYTARSWAPSVELMQQPLQQKDLLEPMLQSLIWFYNCNKIYDEKSAVADMDYLNTLAASDLRILALGKDGPEKAARLHQFSKWISKMLSENTPGNAQGFKPDGSLYHHNMHYFGYGIPAITNIVHKVVAPFDGTPFEISNEAYAALKMRYIAASYWAYPHAGFNSCGRHPLTASGEKMKSALLKLAKSKPGTTETDSELARIYSDIFDYPHNQQSPSMPNIIVMNHNASLSLKKDGNTVHIKGWGDGIKRGETYKKDNRYGNYLTHGSIQIFKHTTDHTSGNEQDGWDWSSIPGTTSLLQPHDVLEGGKGFYGKKTKQKHHPSGAGVLNGKYGAFLFQLDNTTDDESLTVRKSVFVINDSLICLGSNISNDSTEYPTITTLFQTIPLGGNTDALKSSLTENGSWIINSYETGYFLPGKQAFKTTSGEQTSKHNKTRAETKGYFNKGWINHGTTAKDASYQFHVLLNATPEKMKAWKNSYADRIKVLQQNETAHHIIDSEQKLEALTSFGACSTSAKKSYIAATTHSCVVLIKQESPTQIKLSHTNVNIDGIGQKSSTASVTLKGKWKITDKNAQDCNVKIESNTTIITFSGEKNAMGMSQELTLQQQ